MMIVVMMKDEVIGGKKGRLCCRFVMQNKSCVAAQDRGQETGKGVMMKIEAMIGNVSICEYIIWRTQCVWQAISRIS